MFSEYSFTALLSVSSVVSHWELHHDGTADIRQFANIIMMAAYVPSLDALRTLSRLPKSTITVRVAHVADAA